MNAEICYLTKNRSYSNPENTSPVGIVVHSTGANNPYIKRYVQPSEDDTRRDYLLEKIGVNRYGNSWNRSGVNKSVHFFIGKLNDGSVGTVQALPIDIACWGCGRGEKGSYNYNPTAHIQFEICEDDLKDKSYFKAVYSEAVSLCAALCKELSLSADTILSHSEASKHGFASNHKDIDHWLKKFGLSMQDFRRDVEKLLDPFILYRVVKGDTLKKIAKKYKTTVSRIIELNCNKYPSLKTNPNLIKIGWVFTIDRV
ncbi:MAG: LysM peptidoglycan-binding domain-containing protein [Clostridia bacterium]|nr:LysM peptidoglycan-binding domain-containing protein [Clostridia bacterium]